MKRLNEFTKEDWKVCHWRGARETFHHIATSEALTQSQQVVKPLHWYIACRLVIEGGFLPEQIKPAPPFEAMNSGRSWKLRFDRSKASGSEATVLGGLKTKDVDVVVERPGIGPVVAISCKTTGNAFRNLTNRMEEAVGECTNLHMAYPALVTGFFSLLRANRAGSDPNLNRNDISILEDGTPIDGIVRYHEAFRHLEGRTDIRNSISKYEVVALALVETGKGNEGALMTSFPPCDSPLRVERFFDTIYRKYDERFVFAAPIFANRNITPRLEWASDSPVFQDSPDLKCLQGRDLDYSARVGE